MKYLELEYIYSLNTVNSQFPFTFIYNVSKKTRPQQNT
jgi:hypothetical protein